MIARTFVLTMALVTLGCVGIDPCVGPPGMYVDDACSVLAPDLVAYEPAYPLWADGATKERFVRLPPDTTIDVGDPDDWVFPVGTTFYKTFSVDGLRLETRVLRKVREGVGVEAWDMRVYAWDTAQRHVVDVTTDTGCPTCAALRRDALGTTHDVPDGSMCRQCHAAARDVVNGFSAIQLGSGASGLDLDALIASGRVQMTREVRRTIDVPGSDVERAAIGYLHGNCGHCHRESDPSVSICTGSECCRTPACLSGLHAWVRASDERAEDTDAFTTTVRQRSVFTAPGVTCRIAPGHADASVLLYRMASREPAAAMPRIASDQVDAAGVATIRAWIDAMPAGATACE